MTPSQSDRLASLFSKATVKILKIKEEKKEYLILLKDIKNYKGMMDAEQKSRLSRFIYESYKMLD